MFDARNSARLAIVDAAAIVARARAEDWAGVAALAEEVVVLDDHASNVIELLARLVAVGLTDLAAARSEHEDDVFDEWIASAAETVGVDFTRP